MHWNVYYFFPKVITETSQYNTIIFITMSFVLVLTLTNPQSSLDNSVKHKGCRKFTWDRILAKMW
jgi:hypothetical protein